VIGFTVSHVSANSLDYGSITITTPDIDKTKNAVSQEEVFDKEIKKYTNYKVYYTTKKVKTSQTVKIGKKKYRYYKKYHIYTKYRKYTLYNRYNVYKVTHKTYRTGTYYWAFDEKDNLVKVDNILKKEYIGFVDKKSISNSLYPHKNNAQWMGDIKIYKGKYRVRIK